MQVVRHSLVSLACGVRGPHWKLLHSSPCLWVCWNLLQCWGNKNNHCFVLKVRNEVNGIFKCFELHVFLLITVKHTWIFIFSVSMTAPEFNRLHKIRIILYVIIFYMIFQITEDSRCPFIGGPKFYTVGKCLVSMLI